MKYILALDQGTTSSRAIVFDHNGSIISTAQQEFRQIFPKPGWVEHDAQEIWASQSYVAAQALNKANLTAGDVAAIGITNQRETTVVWDRATGKPICNAIVWQDRRTADVCAALRAAGHEPGIARKTGLLLDPYFSATKIAWLLDHVAGAPDAARTLLLDIHSASWDGGLADLFRVPLGLLPEVRDCAGDFGTTELFGGPIRILGGAGDQQAATVGQGCFTPGMMKSTYGTGCFALLNTGAQMVMSRNRLLTTIAYQLGGERTYALEGA